MRVAVIGLGSAGRRHSRLAMELGHEVVGYDPESAPPDGAAAAASLAGALSPAEAAVIASPSALHAEHAAAALNAGLPTLVEKPLATNVADARRVQDVAEQSGRVSGVAMNLRFHPGPIALKQLMEDGELGRVLLARVSYGQDLRLWRPGTDYRQSYSASAALGGGILLDAIHEIDELLWLLGAAQSVSAELARVSDLEIDVEDVALAAIRFDSGSLATVDVNFFEPAFRRSCLIVGTSAVAEWDWMRATVVIRREDQQREISAAAEAEDDYRAELSDFFQAVADDRAPRSTIAEGVAAVELVEAAKHSSEQGRRIKLGG